MSDEVLAALAAAGVRPTSIVPLASDASERRFFRLSGADGTLVACLYSEDATAQAERDWAVHLWGWEHALPIPEPKLRSGRVTVCEDLGDVDLERALAKGRRAVLPAVLDALAGFQRTSCVGLPTPGFDAPFFRRELAVFEEFGLTAAGGVDAAVSRFLDDLAAALAAHPARLVHRDFHVNNLFLAGEVVRAVDFQDMRSGPDTYDAASLLRERAGACGPDEEREFVVVAARRLGWPAGWERRYLECAAQRGLKVIGTFLRLAAQGRGGYLRWLDPVRHRAAAALTALRAPGPLVRAAAGV